MVTEKATRGAKDQSAPTATDSDRPQDSFPVVTTPTAPRRHGTTMRGVDTIPSSSFREGRFGRMFRNVPVFEHGTGQLTAIAATMIAKADKADTQPVADPPEPDEEENPLIPAGYTYLGQFVDHDITFDPASSLQRQNDPDALHDFRTPRFDLDSVYGRGPADQPYLYRQGHTVIANQKGFDERGVTLLLGRSVDTTGSVTAGPDVPRNSDGRALIGDPRNDENIIVSQLHVLFMKFHNAVVERTFEQTGLVGDNLFKEAQRLVRWHYQWIVVHDFLPRIVDGDDGSGGTAATGVVGDILRRETYQTVAGAVPVVRPKFQFYKPHVDAYIPVEFAVAAYRFGHSMIRPSYFINDVVKAATGNARISIFGPHLDSVDNLNGFRPLPDQWGIDWKFFYDLGEQPAQRSYKIDAELVNPLHRLPADVADHPRNLALRNLLRGSRLGLPSGQTVARAMGISPLTGDQLGLRDIAPDFADDAPLWYYVLKEAELVGESKHLGPVGGRIVAEVLVGILVKDPLSYINVAPSWVPDFGVDGKFGMPELVNFVG